MCVSVMGELHILNKREQKEIYGCLRDQFGYTKKFDKALLKSQKDKIYLCSKSVFELDLKNLRIDTIGLYFGRIVPKGLRLSIEGAQIIGPYATKGILSISHEQMKDWISGLDVATDDKDISYKLLKYEDIFVGCGYVKDGKILNYVPKNRRLS